MTIWCKAALTAVIAMLALSAPRPSFAQGAVVCVNCSTEWTAAMNYAKTVEQLLKQVEMLKLAYQNTKALADFSGPSSIAGFNSVNSILAQATSLSYAMSNFDAEFGKKFKDYNGYASTSFDMKSLIKKRQQWAADMNSTTKSTSNAMAKQNEQIKGDEEQAIQRLMAKAQSSQGALQAQQTALLIAIENLRQMQKLRQLVMMNTQVNINQHQNRSDLSNILGTLQDGMQPKPITTKGSGVPKPQVPTTFASASSSSTTTATARAGAGTGTIVGMNGSPVSLRGAP